MARIFTINFEYEGTTYAAIVAAWKNETEAEHFQVSLTDEALHHLAPNGVLRFSLADDVAQLSSPHAALLKNLKTAISHYMQSSLI